MSDKDVESRIRDSYTEMTDRELARELDVPERRVEEVRRELGLNRLAGDDERLEEMEVSKELSETDTNRIQGYLGEQLARHTLPEIRREVSSVLGSGWTVAEKAELLPLDSAGSARLGDTYGTSKLEFSGDTVVFSDLGLEEAVEQARERAFVAGKELVSNLVSAEFPSIDLVLHALKLSGETRRTLEFRNRFDPAFESEKRDLDLPLVEDGKVVHVEVKTSTVSDPGDMLTSLQRRARSHAESSPYSEFYTLHVNLDLDDLDVPDSFDASVRRHDV
nr:MAG: hypothetical protein J07AB56_12400 [Candidatus Nanosalinarum sp. J07AB56]